METFLTYSIPGIPFGCDYALMAVGLVLTFSATGVFNLAFGAQAFLAAFVFDLLVQVQHLPTGIAFVLSVLVVSPALGWALDRALFRHIPTASTTAKVVVSVALLVAIPQAIPIVFHRTPRNDPAVFSFWPQPRLVHLELLGSRLNGSQLTITVMTVVAVGALMVVIRWTSLGLRMRAVVESRRLAQLEGVDAGRVSAWAWMLSSAMAGVAGVMLIPLSGSTLDPAQPLTFTSLLIGAVTAAALASMRSVPVALAGGIGLGILRFLLTGYLPSGNPVTYYLVSSLPFALLLVVLLANRNLRTIEDNRDPLASVDPPPPAAAITVADPRIRRLMKIGWRALLVAYLISLVTWVPSIWVTALVWGMTMSVIFLSITMVTGMAGQLSLAQATFAGIGAFTAGLLADHFGLSVVLGAVAGGLIAAAVGAVIALLTMLVSGLILTLVTLTFAIFADTVLFQLSWTGGSPVTVPRPVIGPFNFGDGHDRLFGVLVILVLAFCTVLVLLVQNGTTGRFLAAMRGSPTGAAGIGINLRRSKILVFVMSAGIAAVGGAMFGSLYQTASSDNWVYEFSLAFVVVVVTTGSRTVEGAINAGMAYAILSTAQTLYLHSLFGFDMTGVVTIFFALGAMTYARHPEGVLEYQKTRALNWVSRHIQARWGPPTAAPGDAGASQMVSWQQSIPAPTTTAVVEAVMDPIIITHPRHG